MPRVKKEKVGKVLGEFAQKQLKSSSGQVVKKKSQALAIALNEAQRGVAKHLHPKSIGVKKGSKEKKPALSR